MVDPRERKGGTPGWVKGLSLATALGAAALVGSAATIGPQAFKERFMIVPGIISGPSEPPQPISDPKRISLEIIPSLTPTAEPIRDFESIVMQIKNLGIAGNLEELHRWRTFEYGIPVQRVKITETNVMQAQQEAQRRLDRGLTFMNSSQNLHLNLAGQTFSNPNRFSDQRKPTELRRQFVPRFEGQNAPVLLVIGVGLNDERTQARFTLTYSIDALLNEFDFMSLVLTLTRDAKVIRDLLAYRDFYPGLSTEQGVARMRDILDPTARMQSHGRAYGETMSAVIYQIGMGEQDMLPHFFPEITAFMKAGRDPSSESWLAYVAGRGGEFSKTPLQFE